MILQCRLCKALVNAEYVAGYKYFWSEAIVRIEGGQSGSFELWKCPNCQSPFLLDNDGYGSVVLFPQDRIYSGLPETIKSAYYEAKSCFDFQAYTASAIMCRKTLEGICAVHNAIGKNLVSKLRDLKERDIIESRLFQWADALRISGNEAAHDVEVTFSQEDARDILVFTNALLEYLFVFRDRFEQFKKRRAGIVEEPSDRLSPQP